MPNESKCAIGVTIAAVVVFIAAFLPWGTITPAQIEINSPFGNASPFGQSNPFGQDGPFGQRGPFGGGPLANLQLTITVNGWNGHITLFGLKLPNWLVVVTAAGAAGICWIKSLAAWEAPLWLPLVLAVYGLFHVGFALVLLSFSEEGTPGVGSYVTMVALIAMVIVLLRHGQRQPAAIAG